MRKRQKHRLEIEDFRPLNYNNYMAGIDLMFSCSTKMQKNEQK
jgi:hypothetical protein